MRCADAVFASGQPAFVAERSMQGESLYLPLKTDARIYGVLCVRADGRSERIEPDEMAFIEAVAGLAAVSVARAKLEEEARIAQLSAASERLRTSLLDSISHELRTPLAAIIGSATGMLESGDLLNGDDQQNLLSTIREGAFRMDRLVCNLLGIVRLESGMLQLRRQWCDMTDVVGVTLRHLAESLQSRVVKVDIPDDLPAVYVDDVLLEQVLVNVLSNAIKYSEEDSDIVVSVRMHGDVLEIVVRDRGVGIDVKEEARIFDKFYRGARTSHIPGTGLGLAICKGIAQAHGGDIKARAVDGDGLEMVVTLPAGSCTTDEGYVQEG